MRVADPTGILVGSSPRIDNAESRRSGTGRSGKKYRFAEIFHRRPASGGRPPRILRTSKAKNASKVLTSTPAAVTIELMVADSPPAGLSDESETRRWCDKPPAATNRPGRCFWRGIGSPFAMVAVRMDRRLQGRIDPSDVIQEACIVAAKQFRRTRLIPQGLLFVAPLDHRPEAHRTTSAAPGGQPRGGPRNLAFSGEFPKPRSAELAAQFLGNLSSPSQNAIRVEQTIQLQEALISLDPLDREILALRHFEQLSNGEAAEVLGLDKSAASKRYAGGSCDQRCIAPADRLRPLTASLSPSVTDHPQPNATAWKSWPTTLWPAIARVNVPASRTTSSIPGIGRSASQPLATVVMLEQNVPPPNRVELTPGGFSPATQTPRRSATS